ncbi:MAG: protein phosphatase 2C domain-containing protein [Tannerellaceae bacterium]|jgi:serine/threonine protein phosphatase PrpC|nr:protein phosphatase 2C domain-containing protein [Tannerellaceae bacterium]
MIQHTPYFSYAFSGDALVDTGRMRTSNQDEVVLCPEEGFYAVLDGMGGLHGGGRTSAMIKQILPGAIQQAIAGLKKEDSPPYAAELLAGQVRMISDTIYNTANKGHRAGFGSTLSGVWLTGRHAIFVNLGDSRGYLLPRYKKKIRQITRDHNVAAILVEDGELTREQARNHPGSSQLTRFAGMTAPATPDVFIQEVHPGDRILLCSDGLHGMIDDTLLPHLMRSSRNPTHVCKRLINEANTRGGRDNISAVYLQISTNKYKRHG